MNSLAYSYLSQGRHDDAGKLYRKVLKIHRQTLGDEHSDTLGSMNSLASVYLNLDRFDEADKLYRERLEILRRTLGDEHPGTLLSMGDLANVHAYLGRDEEAKVLVGKLRETCEELIRINSPNAKSLDTVAWLLTTSLHPELRDPGRALRFAEKAAEIAPNTWSYTNTLGVAQYRAGNWNAAVETLTKSMELAPGSRLGSGAFFLAMAHWQLGEKEKAREWYDKAVEWMDKNGPHNEELIRFRTEAAELLGIDGATVPTEPEQDNGGNENAQ